MMSPRIGSLVVRVGSNESEDRITGCGSTSSTQGILTVVGLLDEACHGD